MARRNASAKKPTKTVQRREKGASVKGRFSASLESVRSAFFERKPIEREKMTPLQKRMQSGGPPTEPIKLK
jgi:hypothetical protein